MQDDNLDKRFDGALSEEVNNANCEKSGNPRPESPEHSDVDDEIIFVPSNPRTWSEKNIETWWIFLVDFWQLEIKVKSTQGYFFRLTWASKKFRLSPPLDASRFPKKAEELFSFSKADFYIVCGSFQGGRKISQHFKYLMQNANESFNETLQRDCDPGD